MLNTKFICEWDTFSQKLVSCFNILLRSFSKCCSRVLDCHLTSKWVSEHPSKSSLVWTLSKESSDSKRKTTASLRYQVLPHIFPWKRSTYWRHSFNNFRVNSDKPSLSIIRYIKLQIVEVFNEFQCVRYFAT